MHRGVWILVLLHFLLAGAYALLTPYRAGGNILFQNGAYAADIGAPDERQHVNYVRHLARGEGFPVLSADPSAPGAYDNYQSHQPPAFYILAAGLAKVAGLDLESRSGGLGLRFLNACIGSAGVLGVYFFALWGLRHPEVALGAAALAALLPMNLALSGAVSNDPLLLALCSWSLAMTASAIRTELTLRRALAIAVLVGLAFLTKTSSIALWPAVALGLYLAARPQSISTPGEKADHKPQAGSARLATLGLALVLPLLIALPWWLRNKDLYGDLLGMKTFGAAFAGTAQAADFIQGLGAFGYWTGINEYGVGVGWWTLRSFFGVFGYMDIFWPSWLYVGLGLALAATVAARIAAPRDKWLVESASVRWTGGLFFGIVVALFLRFNSQYFQGQARYLLPAIAPIAATIAMGVWSLSRRRPLAGVYGLVLLLSALNMYALVTLPGEFERRLGPPLSASPSMEP